MPIFVSRKIKLVLVLIVLASIVIISNIFHQRDIPKLIVLPLSFTDTTQPYKLNGYTWVMPWAAIKFTAGVRVVAEEGAQIYSFGALEINGTEALPVQFYAENNTRMWVGICIRNTKSQIKNVIIRDAELAIKVRGSNVTMDYLLLENVIEGIYVRESKVSINHVNITPVENGGQRNINVIKFAKSEVILENSVLRAPKSALKIDTIDMGYCTNSKIVNNIFYGSPLPDTDAIDVGDQSDNIIVSGNRIYDFSDKGISVGQSSNVLAFDNLFVNCGIGISAVEGSEVNAYRNTFIQNDTGVLAQIDDSNEFGGTIYIKDSIFYQCSRDFYQDDKSSITIDTSLSNTKMLPGSGNILAEPAFKNPQAGSFALVKNPFEKGKAALKIGVKNNHAISLGAQLPNRDLRWHERNE